jgi:hypothetical protein
LGVVSTLSSASVAAVIPESMQLLREMLTTAPAPSALAVLQGLQLTGMAGSEAQTTSVVDGLRALPIFWTGIPCPAPDTTHAVRAQDCVSFQALRSPLVRVSAEGVDFTCLRSRGAAKDLLTYNIGLTLYEIYNSTESSVENYMVSAGIHEWIRKKVILWHQQERRRRHQARMRRLPLLVRCPQCTNIFDTREPLPTLEVKKNSRKRKKQTV